MKYLCLLLVAASLVGCATKRDFYAMSGSRADGTVDMAYDINGPFDQPVVSKSQADGIAKQKCNVWGYSDAEPFGGQSERCNQRNGFGKCISGQIVIQYQCLGDLGASSTPKRTPANLSSSGASVATDSPLSKEQWRQRQLDQLQKSGISYEEYQRRYREIMSE